MKGNCQICLLPFKEVSSLTDHIKTDHGIDEPVVLDAFVNASVNLRGRPDSPTRKARAKVIEEMFKKWDLAAAHKPIKVRFSDFDIDIPAFQAEMKASTIIGLASLRFGARFLLDRVYISELRKRDDTVLPVESKVVNGEVLKANFYMTFTDETPEEAYAIFDGYPDEDWDFFWIPNAEHEEMGPGENRQT